MGEVQVSDHYQPYFCEENVWHLANRLSGTVFMISNIEKSVMLWEQKMADQTPRAHAEPTETASVTSPAVCWDYHVIFATGVPWAKEKNPDNEDALVYDFDTRLPFPCPIRRYFESTFRPLDQSVPQEARPKFRVLSSEAFVTNFHSDRSHMRNELKEWSALPPSWPPIINHEANARPLHKLLDFENDKPSEVMSLDDIMKRL